MSQTTTTAAPKIDPETPYDIEVTDGRHVLKYGGHYDGGRFVRQSLPLRSAKFRHEGVFTGRHPGDGQPNVDHGTATIATEDGATYVGEYRYGDDGLYVFGLRPA